MNALRLTPYFMRSDDILSGYVSMLSASCRVVWVRTVFFPVVCECFPLDTALYVFGTFFSG